MRAVIALRLAPAARESISTYYAGDTIYRHAHQFLAGRNAFLTADFKSYSWLMRAASRDHFRPSPLGLMRRCLTTAAAACVHYAAAAKMGAAIEYFAYAKRPLARPPSPAMTSFAQYRRRLFHGRRATLRAADVARR